MCGDDGGGGENEKSSLPLLTQSRENFNFLYSLQSTVSTAFCNSHCICYGLICLGTDFSLIFRIEEPSFKYFLKGSLQGYRNNK